SAPEAALIQNKSNMIDLIDGYGYGPVDGGASKGMVIGSLIGILGGPIGVLLGAATGALAGSVSDDNRAIDTASVVAVVAGKIYDGETAIAALVQEEEPAFDAVFADYKTTVIRYDAADIADDVERFYDFGAELTNQMVQEVKADRKAERAERREEQRAKIKAGFDEYAEATNRSMGDIAPA
ncbi:MAG: DUF1269 domain-containing protein, partial [Eggerthellaceae bacterium]|nr:DUF1269 domain-containing protein [Eggerthellaceae bacterium]